MTEKICPTCGNPFTVPPTRPGQKYCSAPCSVQGRQADKDEAAKARVDKALNELLSLDVLDALNGRLEAGSTNNRMTVKGARTWEDKRFIVLVVDE